MTERPAMSLAGPEAEVRHGTDDQRGLAVQIGDDAGTRLRQRLQDRSAEGTNPSGDGRTIRAGHRIRPARSAAAAGARSGQT